MKTLQIKRRVLRMILESSKDIYPNEFAALLKVNQKGIISELVFLPGTLQGRSSAVFALYMMPISYDIVGTVHSHPTPNCTPSDEDLVFFERLGYIHIIAGYPFDMSSWQAYDRTGKKKDLIVV
jgi:proteasome lid subunit RPN8/RPN11